MFYILMFRFVLRFLYIKEAQQLKSVNYNGFFREN